MKRPSLNHLILGGFAALMGYSAVNAQPFKIETTGPAVQAVLRYRDGRMEGGPNGILLSTARGGTLSFSARQVPETVWLRRSHAGRGAYPRAPWHEYTYPPGTRKVNIVARHGLYELVRVEERINDGPMRLTCLLPRDTTKDRDFARTYKCNLNPTSIPGPRLPEAPPEGLIPAPPPAVRPPTPVVTPPPTLTKIPVRPKRPTPPPTVWPIPPAPVPAPPPAVTPLPWEPGPPPVTPVVTPPPREIPEYPWEPPAEWPVVTPVVPAKPAVPPAPLLKSPLVITFENLKLDPGIQQFLNKQPEAVPLMALLAGIKPHLPPQEAITNVNTLVATASPGLQKQEPQITGPLVGLDPGLARTFTIQYLGQELLGMMEGFRLAFQIDLEAIFAVLRQLMEQDLLQLDPATMQRVGNVANEALRILGSGNTTSLLAATATPGTLVPAQIQALAKLADAAALTFPGIADKQQQFINQLALLNPALATQVTTSLQEGRDRGTVYGFMWYLSMREKLLGQLFNIFARVAGLTNRQQQQIAGLMGTPEVGRMLLRERVRIFKASTLMPGPAPQIQNFMRQGLPVSTPLLPAAVQGAGLPLPVPPAPQITETATTVAPEVTGRPALPTLEEAARRVETARDKVTTAQQKEDWARAQLRAAIAAGREEDLLIKIRTSANWLQTLRILAERELEKAKREAEEAARRLEERRREERRIRKERKREEAARRLGLILKKPEETAEERQRWEEAQRHAEERAKRIEQRRLEEQLRLAEKRRLEERRLEELRRREEIAERRRREREELERRAEKMWGIPPGFFDPMPTRPVPPTPTKPLPVPPPVVTPEPTAPRVRPTPPPKPAVWPPTPVPPVREELPPKVEPPVPPVPPVPPEPWAPWYPAAEWEAPPAQPVEEPVPVQEEQARGLLANIQQLITEGLQTAPQQRQTILQRLRARLGRQPQQDEIALEARHLLPNLTKIFRDIQVAIINAKQPALGLLTQAIQLLRPNIRQVIVNQIRKGHMPTDQILIALSYVLTPDDLQAIFAAIPEEQRGLRQTIENRLLPQARELPGYNLSIIQRTNKQLRDEDRPALRAKLREGTGILPGTPQYKTIEAQIALIDELQRLRSKWRGVKPPKLK